MDRWKIPKEDVTGSCSIITDEKIFYVSFAPFSMISRAVKGISFLITSCQKSWVGKIVRENDQFLICCFVPPPFVYLRLFHIIVTSYSLCPFFVLYVLFNFEMVCLMWCFFLHVIFFIKCNTEYLKSPKWLAFSILISLDNVS